ncbi:hypothetical protein CK203_063332 [Vitis vinifera]|uniref:Uncharacterized protein n=1 Tax=Vitis vinifera TaxID=29760 RepID=A0A438FPA7_VITVI|nr:hypothetical protein CK203_063332 [Vitis vinifera]
MFLSCSIVQCLSGDNRHLNGKNRSLCSSNAPSVPSHMETSQDLGSSLTVLSKAERAVCNMLGLLLSDPGKLPFDTELCFENEVVLPRALSFGLAYGTEFRAGFPCLENEREREESPYEVYLLVAATQKADRASARSFTIFKIESALSASRKIQFETPERADSVLALLRNFGCTNTHISKIVSKYPLLLTANPEKTLLPKLEFFRSVGFSGPDLAGIIVAKPSILKRSLENHVIPNYNFLKSVGMINENIARALRRTYWLTGQSVQTTNVPNIATLKEIGVPMSNISFFLTCHPSAVSQNKEKFSTNVKKVIEMGFDPLRVTFLKAVRLICGMGESMWEHKMEVYRRWGFTDDEIMLMIDWIPYV